MKGLIYLLLLFFSLVSCKSTDTEFGTNITDSEIYEFMNFVVEDLPISDTVSFQKSPEVLFSKKSDYDDYKISEFVKYKEDPSETRYMDDGRIMLITNSHKVLKPSDTSFILNQNKRLKRKFQWNLERLGFRENQGDLKVYFSIPYFTKDKKSVILLQRKVESSVFLGASHRIFYFTRSEHGWNKEIIRTVVH